MMWNPFKKKNKKKDLSLENMVDSLIDNQVKSMLEACYEYADWNEEEIDEIYVFCSTEEGLFPKWFYRIHSRIVNAHEINDHIKHKCDTSTQRQFEILDRLVNDLIEIETTFENQEQEVPTRIKISFNVHTNKFNVDLDYKKELTGTDVSDHDLLERWMNELM